MKISDFRSRAIREGLRYGEDRMVFLREFGQNARDAKARSISVAANLEPDHLNINFSDNGTGMTFEHAQRFLFTLYASSKENESGSVGKYGVGFWSVLLLDPDSILIESITKAGERWAVEFDKDLETQRLLDCSVHEQGTRVRLKKRVDRQEGERVIIELKRSLQRYCAFLRVNDKKARPLSVSFNGERIDKPFSMDGPCWMSFNAGSIDGVVGLGAKPRVEIYCRGILVWRGTTLDELRYGAKNLEDASYPRGLAPVYILNGNDLSVTMDRRALIDDHALARVRRMARRRMRELLGKYLDSAFPRPLHERMRDYMIGLVEDLKLSEKVAPILGVIAVVLIIGVAGAFGPNWLKMAQKNDPVSMVSTSNVGIRTPRVNVSLSSARSFNGPMIDPLTLIAPLSFRYKPNIDLNFRVSAAEDIHPGRGIIADIPKPNRLAKSFECVNECVEVEVNISTEPGLVSIPTPTGHMVLPQTILLNGSSPEMVMITPKGETVLSLTNTTIGTLKYMTAPRNDELTTSRLESLQYLPEEIKLPEAYALVADRTALDLIVDRRVEAVRSFVEQTIKYDRRKVTVKEYNNFLAKAPTEGWVEFVTTFGRGDCDVKNTLAVLMLRRALVASRLAIGYAGEAGKIRPQMHGWIEYYDGIWKSADATGSEETSQTQIQMVNQAVEANSIDGVHLKSLQRGSSIFIVIAAVGFSGVVAILIMFLLLTGRGRRQINEAGGYRVKQRVAADMLKSVIERPEVWLKGNGLSTRKILPVLGTKKFMSLKEAFVLGSKDALWFSTGKTKLAQKAVAAGSRVLDSSDVTFGEMVTEIPRSVNLDEVSSLKPIRPDQLSTKQRPAGELIEELNRLLSRTGETSVRAVPCLGLVESVCRDVNISKLNLGKRDRRFVSFVAISVVHPEMNRYAEGGLKNKSLFAFLLLEKVLAHSELLRAGRNRVRHKVALEILERAS